MFAREGYVLIVSAVAVSIVLVLVGLQMGTIARMLLWTLAAAVTLFTLWFFRDPTRTPPADTSRLLLAPADGRVIEIVEENEPLYLEGPARRISIFLSPLDVHVNRIPADGVIEFDRYVAGEYLVAWHPKASEKNERSQLGLRHASGVRVLFKQIAGAVARRVVYHVGPGDSVRAGDRYGIVKFGSRMDVLVPPHVSIFARVGDRVRGGVTILGHLFAQSDSVGGPDAGIQAP